jgi:putative DNA primase/helicase
LTAVCAALGISSKDLFAPRQRRTTGRGSRPNTRVIARYDYRDAEGTILFQVERTSDKRFRQRRPEGDGWVYGLGTMEPVLYRLPELLAASPDAPVFVTEGEKDVENLRAVGLVATCNPMGAGKWRKDFGAALQGRIVVILPDNDVPGQRHATQVAQLCFEAAASVRIVALPGLAEKGDVSDWLQAGGTAKQLLELVSKAPLWTPAATSFATLNDTGNAKRFLRLHGQCARYCPQRGQWLLWDGRRWVIDELGQALELAIVTAQGIRAEAEQAKEQMRQGPVLVGGVICERPDEDLLTWANRSEDLRRLQAMMRIAQATLALNIESLDADPWLLCVENGTLDLRTGQLHEHHPDDLISKISPVPYDPGAECPTWGAFLDRVFAGDRELIAFVQRAVGYSLTGVTSEQCLFFLYGTGANGKTRFLNAIRETIGVEFSRVLDFGDLEAKNMDRHPTRFARLVGARWVVASECEQGTRFAESVIKQLTGDDPISAHFMFQNHFEFVPRFKLWIAGNHKPTIRGTDEGIWRRVKVIPFTVTIPAEERDPYLGEKLHTERPGILAWAVQGCLAWQHLGLRPPAQVSLATQRYQADMDILGMFLEECCVVAPGIGVSSTELYAAYRQWCEKAGEHPWTQKALALRLRERGHEQHRTSMYRGWVGLGLISRRGNSDRTAEQSEGIF